MRFARSLRAAPTAPRSRSPSGAGRQGVRPYSGGDLQISRTLLGGGSRLAFNNTYTRSGDNEARYEEGSVEEFEEKRTILRYIERSVRSNQLAGQHQLGAQQRAGLVADVLWRHASRA